jgi:lysozyme
MINKPCCIDINHANDISDSPTPLAGLDRVKQDGIFVLIHKATEGTTFRDPRYDARRAKWMSGPAIKLTDVDGTPCTVSPLWGAYHFFHGATATAEANNFLATAQLQDGDMPFLDWEQVGASGFQPSVASADRFCQIIENKLGRVCGIYGGNVPREQFANEQQSSAVIERFAKRPLWFCAYGSVKVLSNLPGPWTKQEPLLWQDDGDRYGPGPHMIPGVMGAVDNSTVVAGMTFAKLHDIWLSLASPVTA